MFPRDVQEQVLASHDDLYHRHARDFATLDIRGGKIAIGSVVTALFGRQFAFDSSRYPRLADTTMRSQA
jgi:hypothetical protein